MISVTCRQRLPLPFQILAIIVIGATASTPGSVGAPAKLGKPYCSMPDCPRDKCRQFTVCDWTSPDVGDGCRAGPTACEWKDPVLKERYTEILKSKARECLVSFIKKNKVRYRKLLYLQPLPISLPDETRDCRYAPERSQDRYCYAVELLTRDMPPRGAGYIVLLEVGAQTCTVYSDGSLGVE